MKCKSLFTYCIPACFCLSLLFDIHNDIIFGWWRNQSPYNHRISACLCLSLLFDIQNDIIFGWWRNQSPYKYRIPACFRWSVLFGIHDNMYSTVGIKVHKRIRYWLVSDCHNMLTFYIFMDFYMMYNLLSIASRQPSTFHTFIATNARLVS